MLAANRLRGGARALAEKEPEQSLFWGTPKLRVSVLPVRQNGACESYTRTWEPGPAAPPVM